MRRSLFSVALIFPLLAFGEARQGDLDKAARLVFEQRYERGKPGAPLKNTGITKRRGTKVRFKSDSQVFETLDFSFDVLAQRLRELAFLNKGLSITLKDERKEPAKEQVFLYKGGIVSFVEHLNEAKTPLHKPIYVKVERPE